VIAGARFSGYPKRIDPGVYAEAIARYADCVAPRTAALYQVGNVSYPGLSDIDLVVVVDRPAWNNNQFFAAQVRLPARLSTLFHHPPRIVPVPVIDAISVSSCGHAATLEASSEPEHRFGSRRRLIRGIDLLGDRTPLDRYDAWLRCRILEDVYLFRRALDGFERSRAIDVTHLVSRAASLRHPMRRLDEIASRRSEPPYRLALDERRLTLLDEHATPDDKERAVAEVLDLFRKGFANFETGVRTLFDIPSHADIAETAGALLSGAAPIKEVDPSYIAQRHAWMATYHAALRDFRFSYGSIFAINPHSGRYRAYRQPMIERIVAGAVYRSGR
jgi:hypothetical protein